MGNSQFEYMVLAMELLDDQSMGRYMLSEKMNLSTAKVRSLLDTLKEKELVETEGKSSGRKGSYLSIKGKNLLAELDEILWMVFEDDFPFNGSLIGFQSRYFCCAFLPKDTVDSISNNVLNLRDNAVRHGAHGAIILTWSEKNNAYCFPNEDKPVDLPDNLLELVSSGCTEGGIIIGFGTSEGQVNIGTISSAIEALGASIDRYRDILS